LINNTKKVALVASVASEIEKKPNGRDPAEVIDLRAAREERAAALEDCGVPRDEAEAMAAEELPHA
jgi:hypothetical protein